MKVLLTLLSAWGLSFCANASQPVTAPTQAEAIATFFGLLHRHRDLHRFDFDSPREEPKVFHGGQTVTEIFRDKISNALFGATQNPLASEEDLWFLAQNLATHLSETLETFAEPGYHPLRPGTYSTNKEYLLDLFLKDTAPEAIHRLVEFVTRNFEQIDLTEDFLEIIVLMHEKIPNEELHPDLGDFYYALTFHPSVYVRALAYRGLSYFYSTHPLFVERARADRFRADLRNLENGLERRSTSVRATATLQERLLAERQLQDDLFLDRSHRELSAKFERMIQRFRGTREARRAKSREAFIEMSDAAHLGQQASSAEVALYSLFREAARLPQRQFGQMKESVELDFYANVFNGTNSVALALRFPNRLYMSRSEIFNYDLAGRIQTASKHQHFLFWVMALRAQALSEPGRNAETFARMRALLPLQWRTAFVRSPIGFEASAPRPTFWTTVLADGTYEVADVHGMEDLLVAMVQGMAWASENPLQLRAEVNRWKEEIVDPDLRTIIDAKILRHPQFFSELNEDPCGLLVRRRG